MMPIKATKAHGASEAVFYAVLQTSKFIDHVLETKTPEGDICRTCYLVSLLGTISSNLIIEEGVELEALQQIIADATKARREATAKEETGVRMQ